MKALHSVVMTLALGIAWPAISAAQTQTPRAPVVPDVPRIDFEKYVLPNGLEVILSPDHRLPMVAVNLWYHVGPANEAAGRTGFAHLFEHMMFQGAKHVPADAHFQLLEGAGATDSNGSTDFDRTNYFDTVPANQLELALWAHSDRMGYLLDVLDQTALSNQQDVVRNERRQSIENRPYGIVEEAIRWTSPVQHFMRMANEDVEIAGVKIAKGDWLMINYVAANHDPAQFEEPRKFDATRDQNRHIAFGAGAHQCLGLHLARLEMRILFEELLDRLDSVELAGEPKRANSTFVGGLKTLPLRFRAS